MKRRLKNMLIAVGLIVLAIVVTALTQIDDWSRDLSSNRAATSADAIDPSLRSLDLSVDAEKVEQAVMRFVERSPSWSLVQANDGLQPNTLIALVRTSRLFRFNDDVNVLLQQTEQGTRVDVTSQSRVGKGDLGQNPRNIRELLQAIRTEL